MHVLWKHNKKLDLETNGPNRSKNTVLFETVLLCFNLSTFSSLKPLEWGRTTNFRVSDYSQFVGLCVAQNLNHHLNLSGLTVSSYRK